MLERHGVVTRGAVVSERVPGGFAGVYKVLSAFEDSGRCRRGYFVEGLGAAQFGAPGAVDRLRTYSRELGSEGDPQAARATVVLAATDPANPYGAALPWPDRSSEASPEDGATATGTGHRPGRKAGALVILVDGSLGVYVERGGKTLLTFTDDPDELAAAMTALAGAVRRGAMGRLTVERADGEAILGSTEPLREALDEGRLRRHPARSADPWLSQVATVPEGDTVWRTARSLDRALTGHVLVTSDFRVPEIATVDLSGQHVEATIARGKHLLTRIGADHTLHTHLKMEGSWHLYRPGSRWRRPTHQARVVLATDDWTAVGFSLGVTELVARGEEESVVGHLGPDLLGPDWDEPEALGRLTADPDRPLVEALLDQRNLAGIGNMYAAELCFLAGVPPHARGRRTRPAAARAPRQGAARGQQGARPAGHDRRPAPRTHPLRLQPRGSACRRCGTRIEQAHARRPAP